MDVIKIEGLERSYGEFRLGPFDLRVEPGAILTVTGHPRGGKTTLLRLLWGFERPTKGRVEVFGMQPHLEQIRVRSRAGYAGDHTWYYPELTTEAFLEFIGAFHENWDQGYALELLKDFHISNWHQISEISHQDRRRLGVIAALGHRPSLVILDQPAAGLDDKMRKHLIRVLKKLAREDKVTFVVSTHISDDLDQIGDGTLVLNHGHVMESTY
jgi:ABC-2 type transport system ATP-binding protein